MSAVKGRQNVTKGDLSVAIVWRMAYNAIIRPWHLQSNTEI